MRMVSRVSGAGLLAEFANMPLRLLLNNTVELKTDLRPYVMLLLEAGRRAVERSV